MRYLLSLLLLAVGLSALPLGLATAEIHLADRPDETTDMIKGLALPKKPLDRGWPTDRGVEVSGGETVMPDTASIDLTVNFAYDSAQLNTDAQLLLDKLGSALNSTELANQRFKIIGHTDAVGGDAYNQTLSEQRAQSVRDYLIKRSGIAGQRLDTEGKGYSQLADPANPTSAMNRRVQVSNLGS